MKSSPKIIFLKDQHLEGLEVCRVSGSNHVFPKHSHEKIYAISLMEKGGSYWCGRDKSSSLVQPGDMAIINPGQLHSGEPVKGSTASYKMLYLNSAHFSRNESLPCFNNILSGDLRLAELFKNLYQSVISSADVLEKDVILTDFVGTIMEKYSFPSLKPEKAGSESGALTKAADFLSEDLDRKITLEELSELTGFSPYHFLRIFKKKMGITPHIYRIQKRIEKSKTMILNGLPLSEVALLSGFTDQSHFSNTFRKYTGATPGQYFLSR